jgi:predicted DsbA family dithiol-disulfide isomerase
MPYLSRTEIIAQIAKEVGLSVEAVEAALSVYDQLRAEAKSRRIRKREAA